MKTQDIIFFLVSLFLIYEKNPRLMIMAGLISLAFSIPLFSFWVFFTAERLIWYAAAFFLLAIIFYLFKSRNER